MLINPLIVRRVGTSSYPIHHEFRSIFSIKGQVMQLGNGIPSTVQLYSKNTMLLISSTPTDDQGFYLFDGLQKTQKYFLVSHHPKYKYNAVIQDNVVPK